MLIHKGVKYIRLTANSLSSNRLPLICETHTHNTCSMYNNIYNNAYERNTCGDVRTFIQYNNVVYQYMCTIGNNEGCCTHVHIFIHNICKFFLFKCLTFVHEHMLTHTHLKYYVQSNHCSAQHRILRISEWLGHYTFYYT